MAANGRNDGVTADEELLMKTASPVGDPGTFTVVHTRVAVRQLPSTNAAALGALLRGQTVLGAPWLVKNTQWLKLESAACNEVAIDAESAWVLIHGKSVGLGELLRRQPLQSQAGYPLKEQPQAASGASGRFRAAQAKASASTNRPKAATSSDPVAILRSECAQVGLEVLWCDDVEQLQSMLNTARGFARKSLKEVSRECHQQRVNVDGLVDKESILARLLKVHVWNHMSNEDLLETCWQYSIPIPRGYFDSRYSHVREADRSDTIDRLKQHFIGLRSGELGPLPVEENRRMLPPAGWKMPHWQVKGGSRKLKPKPKEEASNTRSTSDDAERRDENAEWNVAGPRVHRYMEKFPYFEGEVPGRIAELYWTDAELQRYFETNGYIAPAPHPAQDVQVRDITSQLATLGLTSEASAEQIRKAYHNMALRCHPDKNPGQEATAEFQRITAAYETVRNALNM